MLPTKVHALHHRWPLLDDNQDPLGLPARVAFHLHRLGLTSTALRKVEGISRAQARDLRRGTLRLTGADVQWLHAMLGLEDELSRALTDAQQLEWTFYRISARHPTQVWQNAHAAWAGRLSLREVAHLVGVPSRSLHGLVAGERQHPILTRPPAVQLANALTLEKGAEAFVYAGFLDVERSR